jgi:hypothetical protein
MRLEVPGSAGETRVGRLPDAGSACVLFSGDFVRWLRKERQ